jgi:pSer/pThr/pTyr-binding forkhead associated (FHA) protein
MDQRALELFRLACGLQAPLDLECRDAGRPDACSVSYRFEQPFILVGRDARSDLVLDDPRVSSRHAVFQATGGRVFCIDLQSRSGMVREGASDRQSRAWLSPGETVCLGPFGIHWTEVPDGNAGDPDWPDPLVGEPAGTMEACVLPQARLLLPIRVGNEESLWRLDSQLALVGRSDDCQLVLSDDSVSRHHALLIRTSSGLWVVDLLAREGVQVNGDRVRWAWLDDGDNLRIGRFTFIVRYEAASLPLRRQDVPLEAGAVTKERLQAAAKATRLTTGGGTALALRPKVNPPAPLRSTRVSPATLPGALAASAETVWEPPVLIGPDQMLMWQQQMQMMESFHKDMILMVQMFVAMHREHLVSVRDELDRVQQLTRELSELQQNLLEAPEKTGARRRGRDSLTSPPANRSKNGTNSAHHGPRTEQDAGSTNDAARPRPASPRDAGAAAGDDRTAPASRPAPTDDLELHGQLTKRIADLQRERQGYWQKILGVINQ